jgi:midasin
MHVFVSFHCFKQDAAFAFSAVETSDFIGGFRPARTRERDLATFRATAQELLQSQIWNINGHYASAELTQAAESAASPVEVEELLQALLGHLSVVRQLLQAALDQPQQGSLPPQCDAGAGSAAAAVAAACGTEELQLLLQGLDTKVAGLRAAAAAARSPFGWEDGPLVVAMKAGELLLVDELNLAEDAVLERLNR